MRAACGIGLIVLAVSMLVERSSAGSARASAGAPRCTITGTRAGDRLVGTARRDVICGLGGSDVIIANAGSDVVRGGTGADTIVGGAGDDAIDGGSGNDRIAAGAGDDFVKGGAGADAIALDGGNDLALTIGENRDRVKGGRGWDRGRIGAADRHEGVEQLLRGALAGTISVLAAGDIAACGSLGAERTAALLDVFPESPVLALGDEAYPAGTSEQFASCYDPTWGRARARTHPIPGNHDYLSAGAAPYFAYFGAAAAPPGGYYSFDLNGWHVIALNSNCAQVGGCQPGSAQYRWLEADLGAHRARCTLALSHHPRYSSAPGAVKALGPIWSLLYRSGVDVLLTGHVHLYERLRPLGPTGAPDPASGIREFIVGTGGAYHERFGKTRLASSDAFNDSSFGVLRLTLARGSYSWDFLPAVGATFRDSGTAACH